MGFSPIILIAVLAPIFGIMAFYCAFQRRKQRKKMIEMNGPRGILQQEWWNKIKSQIALRVEQEADNTKGTRVWFSRHIERGAFRHWILIIENIKYELRQNHTTKAFYVNVQSCTLDEERRKKAVEKVLHPEYDGHYVCLIGWTRKSPDELARIAHEVGDNWDYSKILNNCQHYLKRFADQILETETAADYTWFYDNTRTEYQNSRMPPPTPEEIIAMHQAQQQVMNSQTQHHHQHQLNMQQVNQMAIAQLNASNLAIMGAVSQATNPAMNPALNPAMNPGMNPGMFGGGMGMGMGGGGGA